MDWGLLAAVVGRVLFLIVLSVKSMNLVLGICAKMAGLHDSLEFLSRSI